MDFMRGGDCVYAYSSALTDTSVAAATPWVLGLVALTYALVRIDVLHGLLAGL